MSKEQPTVADIFRRAQAIRRENPQMSYSELKARLVEEHRGAPFPSPDRLTIPEQDARAPEEDWTAGLPLVMRGIQQQDWKEIAGGIVLSLEQTENYESTRGANSQRRDDWHDRSVGIKGSTDKGVGKWMPADLMALAERKSKE
jgi:hypothetical protein